jgi:hypothetical protein
MTDRGSAVDVLVGGILGAVVGAIVAVNVVIYSGVDQGYETSPGDLFAQRPVAGVMAVVALVAGPPVGMYLARRLRRRRERP